MYSSKKRDNANISLEIFITKFTLNIINELIINTQRIMTKKYSALTINVSTPLHENKRGHIVFSWIIRA